MGEEALSSWPHPPIMVELPFDLVRMGWGGESREWVMVQVPQTLAVLTEFFFLNQDSVDFLNK